MKGLQEHWPCLHDEALTKVLLRRSTDACAGGWCAPTPRGQELPCTGPFLTLPYVLLHLAVRLYFLSGNKPMDVSVSLKSVSHPSKLPNTRKGLWEPQYIAKFSKVQVASWHLMVDVYREAVSWDWALSLWGLRLTLGRECQSQIKL